MCSQGFSKFPPLLNRKPGEFLKYPHLQKCSRSLLKFPLPTLACGRFVKISPNLACEVCQNSPNLKLSTRGFLEVPKPMKELAGFVKIPPPPTLDP